MFAFGFLGSIAIATGQSCNITPESGKTYVAGFCIELINICNELPAPPPGESGLPGDCFVEKRVEDPASII
ncbi:hypothetical protein SAMN04488104_105222 [Algoriphagus faecimaris]|uniref:Uncharacterized protein n=2 Tax=Algoriphagus faecimaris TaxID=686796 RepID=A0A1G6X7P9_9BACT|nr:hypothetical protein SAMN04488104_105222 [Algoriphagus faecimaris]